MRLFILIILLGSSISSSADYRSAAFHHMVLNADAIVYGEIDSLTEKTFYLTSYQTIGGEKMTQPLEITKFVNWPCAGRWSKYKKGQNVCLLLEIQDKKWRVMGAGNEGEMPIEKGYVNIKFTSLYSGGYLDTPSRLTLEDGSMSGQRFKLAKFLYAMNLITNCFGIENYSKRHDVKSCFRRMKTADILLIG